MTATELFKADYFMAQDLRILAAQLRWGLHKATATYPGPHLQRFGNTLVVWGKNHFIDERLRVPLRSPSGILVRLIALSPGCPEEHLLALKSHPTAYQIVASLVRFFD